MRQVVVAGGGIAGLAAAHRLKRLSEREGRPVSITLLEASERFGGKIRTDRSEGIVVEAGPDSFLTAKPEAVELARELGLGDRLIPTAREGRDVYVYARGRLRRFPEGLLLMAPTRLRPFLASDIVTWKGKLRMALERFLPAGGHGDESLADFTRRRLGREALETIVDPLMAGIYAGDAESLSLKSTFPQFAELESRYGSVIGGLRASARAAPPGPEALTPFVSFAGGLEELVDGLVQALGLGLLRSRSPVQGIRRAGQGYEIAAGGGGLRADAVILALPAADAAAALQAADPYVAGLLREIPAVSTATVTLAFKSEDIPRLPRGFGFVVPKGEGRSITAATFVSQKFPSRGYPRTVIRCFLGGAGREGMIEESEESLTDRARGDLRDLAGIQARPVLVNIFKWNKANPQYNIGHAARLKKIEEQLKTYPGVFIAGASYCGVGIPDCIRSGGVAAERCFTFLTDLYSDKT